ncbi:hypothetical protein LTR37_013407 [Vermiconidia calcicola]|uniref:Uncharacterized protein n=1 Tax=Vermiconidia calcicola TaxID=1690605 RepID=A0ACC3MWJ4_9PEZI|nr:hypothetical protein LTR37_013407 [Vermiconidia calcicola]
MAAPYKPGHVLTLRQESTPTLGYELRVQILEVFEPFTLSCVMRVWLDEDGQDPSEAVLKLYDRRFATQLREDQKIDPWSAQHESAYLEFIRTGQVNEFLNKL